MIMSAETSKVGSIEVIAQVSLFPPSRLLFNEVID